MFLYQAHDSYMAANMWWIHLLDNDNLGKSAK